MEGVAVRRIRYGLSLANAWLDVHCRLDRGSLAFRNRASGRTIIPHAHATVELAGGDTVSTLEGGFLQDYDRRAASDVHGEGLTVCLRTAPGRDRPELRLLLTLYDSQPFALLQVELVNTTSGPLNIDAFRVLAAEKLRLGSSPRRRDRLGWRFYKQGWQSWSPTLSLACAESDVLAPPPIVGSHSLSEANSRFVSELMGLVLDPASGLFTLLGFVTSADQLSQVWLDASRGSLAAVSLADSIVLEPGRRLLSEKLLIDLAGPLADSLPRYGQALGRQMGALGWQHIPTGWCSWYYYWGGISEETVLENLDFLARHRDELPVEYVQLDDGYEADIGDWTTPNKKFPHGLTWVAQRIHDRGFKAGLWLAPLLVGSTSALYRQHPDWVVRDGRGQPVEAIHNWGKDCYALDCTHPQARAWLRQLMDTVVGDWGFDYVKLDFLYAGAVEGQRYDRRATRAQAYRQGLESLRRGVGEKFILGCGAPIGPSIGLFNANRIGPDVAPFWKPIPWRPDAPLSGPSTENALRTVLARYWMHSLLWLNDPDCLMVRDSDTALSPDEVRCLATVIALSGGMVFLSDALPRLSPERREIASLLLPPYGRAAVPLDLFDRSLPRFLRLAVDRPFQQWRLLGVFQWEDEPADVTAPLAAEPVHVFDLWEGRYFGVHQGEMLLPKMPSHSAKLLSLRRVVDHPQVISTSFHFSQGAVEIEDARFDAEQGALTVHLVRPARGQGEVIIHVPPSFRERGLESDAPGASLARRADGLLSVRLTLPRRARFTVLFER